MIYRRCRPGWSGRGHSRETARKTLNLRRDPRASLGKGLVDYYRRGAGEHPDWDDYRAAMERERRVLIRITVECAGPDQSG